MRMLPALAPLLAFALSASAEVPDIGPAAQVGRPEPTAQATRVLRGITDGSLHAREGRLNGTPFKEWSDGSGARVLVGLGADGKPAWIVAHEPVEGGVRTFYDAGATGRVSRMVVNKESAHGADARRQAAENELKAFQPAEGLAREAEGTADLEPEAVKVYILGDGGASLRLVDFKTGQATPAPADQAGGLAAGVQRFYDALLAKAAPAAAPQP